MKQKIINKKVIENETKQKTIMGFIVLSKDVEMINRANFGEYPWSKKWKEPSSIIVSKGTKVEYKGEETWTAFYHTVYYKDDRGSFECSESDKNHSCIKI